MLAALLAVTACATDEPATTARQFAAFGTTVRLQIPQADPDAQAAADAIEQFLTAVGNDWYAFGTGELARANESLSRGEAVTLSPALAAMVARATELHTRSGGLFDPGVCALVRLWQFDRQENLAGSDGPPPDAEIRKLTDGQGTLADVALEGRQLTPRRPLCIDLGGIAKGTALEHIRSLLAERNVRDALIDLGGSSVLALGTRPLAAGSNRPWRIGVRNPRGDGVFATLWLADGEAAATSGDYARSYVQDGHRYHHVLDPRTGLPGSEAIGVTVVARDAELADAAATALMVGGPARFTALCASLGLSDALLIGPRGEMLATPGMEERLRQSNAGRVPRPTVPDL